MLLFASSDNRANIRQALINFTTDQTIRGWVPCITHCLNPTTKRGIDIQQAVRDAISVLPTLVSKIDNSQPVKRRFDELLELHYPGIQHIKLTRDVDTQWNSTLGMLESIIRQRDAVEALANDRCMRPFADFSLPMAFQHWSEPLHLTSRVIAALKPAEEATKLSSLAYCSLSSYIPIIRGLTKQLQLLHQAGEVPGVVAMVEKLQLLLEKSMKWMLTPKPTTRADYLMEKTIIPTFHAI